MNKMFLLFSFFCLMSFSGSVYAEETAPCPPEALTLMFAETRAPLPPGAPRPALLTGAIETPNPGYVYEIRIEKLSEEGVLIGQLFIFEKDGDMSKPAVITPLTIEHSMDIPADAHTIILNVVKDFNWGPWYYEGGISPHGACLKGK